MEDVSVLRVIVSTRRSKQLYQYNILQYVMYMTAKCTRMYVNHTSTCNSCVSVNLNYEIEGCICIPIRACHSKLGTCTVTVLYGVAACVVIVYLHVGV